MPVRRPRYRRPMTDVPATVEGEDVLVLRGWREARLDMLLAEELEASPQFVTLLTAAALRAAGRSGPDGDPDHATVVLNFDDQADGTNAGENDLDVTVTWADGTTRRVLIEDKVWAPLQPRQAERYAARAVHHKGAAVLIAPRPWLDAHPTAAGMFHATQALESLAIWLRDMSPTAAAEPRRMAWRARVLDVLATPRMTGTVIDHGPTIDFRDYCIDWLARHDSTAQARPLSLHTENQGWLTFAHPRDLCFKAIHGTVDLYVADNGFTGDADALAAALKTVAVSLPVGWEVATDTSKHRNVVLRKRVAKLAPSVGVPGDTTSLDEALEACRTIAAWLDAIGGHLPR